MGKGKGKGKSANNWVSNDTNRTGSFRQRQRQEVREQAKRVQKAADFRRQFPERAEKKLAELKMSAANALGYGLLEDDETVARRLAFKRLSPPDDGDQPSTVAHVVKNGGLLPRPCKKLKLGEDEEKNDSQDPAKIPDTTKLFDIAQKNQIPPGSQVHAGTQTAASTEFPAAINTFNGSRSTPTTKSPSASQTISATKTLGDTPARKITTTLGGIPITPDTKVPISHPAARLRAISSTKRLATANIDETDHDDLARMDAAEALVELRYPGITKVSACTPTPNNNQVPTGIKIPTGNQTLSVTKTARYTKARTATKTPTKAHLPKAGEDTGSDGKGKMLKINIQINSDLKVVSVIPETSDGSAVTPESDQAIIAALRAELKQAKDEVEEMKATVERSKKMEIQELKMKSSFLAA